MYWIHRIGSEEGSYEVHFDALWHLLTKSNCLTIGWQCLIGDAAVVNAVHAHDYKQVKSAMAAQRVSEQKARGLANFATFDIGDIVYVLPIRKRAAEFLIVKIKTRAQSILKLPPALQASFPVSSGITFNPTSGFVYLGGSPVDAGFFCEVDILANVPWEGMSPLLAERCSKIRNTNAKV